MTMPDQPAPAFSDQRKIWRHFQNAAPESFAAAHPRLDYLLREIARRTDSQQPSVLNIGIGDGYFEREAKGCGWKITSLDPDSDAVQRLVDKGIAAQVGLIEQIPLPDASQDAVVASEVLEHLNDAQRQAGVVEIARILKPGGWFLGTVPYNENMSEQQTVCPCCGEVFHRWGHQKSFDFGVIRRELGPRFEIVKLGRTAFVPSLSKRGLRGAMKSLVRVTLAKLGEPIAVPTLYWIARKPKSRSQS